LDDRAPRSAVLPLLGDILRRDAATRTSRSLVPGAHIARDILRRRIVADEPPRPRRHQAAVQGVDRPAVGHFVCHVDLPLLPRASRESPCGGASVAPCCRRPWPAADRRGGCCYASGERSSPASQVARLATGSVPLGTSPS